MSWMLLVTWGAKVGGMALAGIITLAIWHIYDLTVNSKKNLMHVAGPRPLPILGKPL